MRQRLAVIRRNRILRHVWRLTWASNRVGCARCGETALSSDFLFRQQGPINTVIRQFNHRTGRYDRLSATRDQRGAISQTGFKKIVMVNMTINTLRTLAIFAVLATDLAALTPAHAALGTAPTYAVAAQAASAGTTSTARLAQASSGAAANYTVNQTTLSSGTVVSEYATTNNTVFGLSWRGPTVAPLQTLLGSYFPAYVQGLAAVHTANGGGYGPAAVRQSALVVETGGHMGAFSGRAYLPQALPQGVSADDIK
jgi:hypothetical protein